MRIEECWLIALLEMEGDCSFRGIKRKVLERKKTEKWGSSGE